ncbi:MAG TPA: alpha/beta hydrolase fold domain-containing protein [Pirellulaceae bacterium]|jgi:acetyl esterase/lipase
MFGKHCLHFGAVVIALVAFGRGQAQSGPAIDAPAVSRPSYTYQSLGERKLQLVMHRPPQWQTQDKRTAIVFFSGSHKVQPDANGKLPPLADERARLGLPIVNRGPGGEHHVPLLDAFAQRGYVCLHVEYRTRGKDGILPGEDIADAINAMRWIRGHARELGIDPDRIVAAGGSSGAYLAASLFTFEGRYPAVEQPAISARPNAILLYSPLVDWLEVGSMSESFLVVLGGDKERGTNISPARHWRKDCPPTLVMVGSNEPPFATVKAFGEKWRDAGAPLELFVADGEPHGFFGKAAWIEKTIALTETFLKQHKLEPIAARAAGAAIIDRPTSAVYKSIGERMLHVAIHYPPQWNPTDARPAMLLFGGGGFNPQDKDTGEIIPNAGDGKQASAATSSGLGQAFLVEAEHFAKLGLVTLCVEYRKRRTDGVLPDKSLEDAKSAMRWGRSNAAKLGIDPNRIVACGGSSGGHLAASLAAIRDFNAAEDNLNISAEPNLLILHYPLLDFLAGGTRKVQFLDALNGNRQLGERLSPARHWTKDMPPALLFIGTNDPMYESVTAFVDTWKKAGGKLELFVGEGAGHGFSSTPKWHDRTLPPVEAFLRREGYLDATNQETNRQSSRASRSSPLVPIATLVEQLHAPNIDSRLAAAIAILESDASREAYPALVQALKDDELLDVRLAATAIFTRPRSAAGAEQLCEALKLGTKARVAAAWELSRIGPSVADIVTAPLLAALAHPDKHERNFVTLALAMSGSRTAEVRRAMQQIADDPGSSDTPQTNYKLPRALAAIAIDLNKQVDEPRALDEDISAIIGKLSSGAPRVNPQIVAGLQSLGAFAGAMSPSPKPQRREPPAVHESISLAIGYLDSLSSPSGPQSIDREEKEGKLSEAARQYLMALGGVQQGIAAVLQQAIADADRDQRVLALRRLASLGAAAKEALPAIESAKADPDWIIRREAYFASIRVRE